MVISHPSRKTAVAGACGFFVFLGALGLSFVPRVQDPIQFQDAASDQPLVDDTPARFSENLIRFPKDDLYAYSRGNGIQHLQTKSAVVFDSRIGPKARAYFHRRHLMKKDGQVIYDVESLTDGYSRRITPGKTHGKNHILFFGCSYVFGEGVRQDETLPYFTAENSKDTIAYNYAFGGWGPNNNLARMQLPFGPGEVPEVTGLGVYVFLDFHIHRAIAALSTARFTHNFPRFVLSEDNQVIRSGFNRTDDPLRFHIYEWLTNSWIAQKLKLDWPLVLQEKHYAYTARLIQQLKNEYQKKFPGQRFLVVLYPQSKTRVQMSQEFQKLNVEYLDYSQINLKAALGRDDAIPYDGHPTALAHEWMAKKMTQDLGI
ncbi:MAG: hypothetical protein K2X47_09215 [Bdellovibrionales bacterium]|nr:hypothetical protein [Bdellovibrionales bacterium]